MKWIMVTAFLLVSACTTSVQNLVSNETLANVEATYGAVLAVAVNYRRACVARKATIYPGCRAIVVQMQSVGKIAQSSVLTARAFVRDNPTIDAGVVISAAVSAVTQFQSVVPQGVF